MLLQTFFEGVVLRGATSHRPEIADARNLSRLLRSRRKRPAATLLLRCRARQEIRAVSNYGNAFSLQLGSASG